jgi:hypothetical protein
MTNSSVKYNTDSIYDLIIEECVDYASKGTNVVHYSQCIETNIQDHCHYFYAPKNTIDKELFYSLKTDPILNSNCFSSKPSLEKLHIQLPINIMRLHLHSLDVDYIEIGDILLYGIDPLRCNKCNIMIPIDMEYYSTNGTPFYDICTETHHKNICSVCKLIYAFNDSKSYHKKSICSGLENITDWILIFSVTKTFPISYVNCHSYSTIHIYCNLNKESKHYQTFAMETFEERKIKIKILPETTLHKIVKTYFSNT